MFPVLIKNATVVNEGVSFVSDVLVKDGHIEKIGENIQYKGNCREIDGTGLHLLPGCYRRPGTLSRAGTYP